MLDYFDYNDEIPERYLNPDYSDSTLKWSLNVYKEITVGWNILVATVERDKDARLISYAPEMYRILLDILHGYDLDDLDMEKIAEIVSYVDDETRQE